MNPELAKSGRGPVWFGIILVVVILGIAGWIYFLSPNQNMQIGVTLTSDPANILVGDPFSVSVTLNNSTGQALKNTAINLVLPSGVIAVNAPTQRVVIQRMGDIGAGGVSHYDFQLVETAAANTVIPITAKVAYSAAASTAQFENDASISIPVGQPVVSVFVAAPNTVFSGQNFPVTVSYTSNANHPVSGFSLAMQYPLSSFSFVSASTTLMADGKNTWDLGAVPPNGSGTIVLTGNLIGAGGASYPIAAALSESVGGQSAVIGNPSTNIAIAESPVSLVLSLNGSQNYISHPNDNLSYVMTVTNNSGVAFENGIVTLKLSGGMFVFSSLKTNGGAFNSLTNTITWNAAAAPGLLSLAPGQSTAIDFSMNTQPAYPIRLLSDKNYTVSASARFQSATVPTGTAASSTISVAGLTTKFGGAISLGMAAYHKEPTAKVVNSGLYPPKVNQPSEYTIHWLVTNYATDVDNVTISAYLQSGTACTGFVTSTAPTAPQCDAANGQVTWQIPAVPAGTGIADRPYEAIFQVTATPSINQVGQDVPLISAAALSSTDAFTGQSLSSGAQGITTVLPDDTAYSVNGRQVSQ